MLPRKTSYELSTLEKIIIKITIKKCIVHIVYEIHIILVISNN